MPVSSPPMIGDQRHAPERQRAELTARRPAVALAAAGGSQEALADARQLTEELADLGVQIDGLRLAEEELARQDAVRRQEAAARARQERAEQAADVQSRLGHALSELEVLLVDVGERVTAIDGLARWLDQLEAGPSSPPPYRQRYAAQRVLGRLRAALRCWQVLLPGGQDARSLGGADVV